MKKFKVSGLGIAAALIALFIMFFFFLVPINLKATEFWMTMILATACYAGGNLLQSSVWGFWKNGLDGVERHLLKPFLLPVGIFAVFVIISISGASLFNARSYASILKVEDAEFTEDLPEALGTDSIALMDTASAKKLGDREIGALSNVVSQFDVSEDYSQIDFQGSPMKVSALYYTGFFKWLNNRSDGIPGYVTVNPVGMNAKYEKLEKGMKYVPSAYLLEDAGRHIWLKYPTTMWGNLHFEIDEEGNPYYVASVYDKKISLFSGDTVSGCITMDPVTGETHKYDLDEVPKWVDEVFDGETICQQYNWYGKYSGGFWNSVISKKGCKKVTSSQVYNDDDEEYVETPDYGYVAKDGDIWIYTGVTSVNSDSSNIGFLLANERTGESHYFSVNGADEKSAMAAAEGEVQEKGYTASFPSLINVDGEPTYIMVLKDASGLVKLYAAVNVEQYNLVTTASSQAECIEKYRKLLGLEPADDGTSSDNDSSDNKKDDANVPETTEEATIKVKDIKYIDIDGNTYIYIITDDDKIYKAKASSHEDMLLLNIGDEITITYSGNEIY